MEGDVGAIDAEEPRDLRMQGARTLRADPDLDRFAVRTDRCRRIQRLHLGVINVAGAVLAAIGFRGAAQCRLDVALTGIDRTPAALVARNPLEVFERLLAIEMGARRISAPGDIQQVFCRLRRLDTRSDDADALRQPHDVGDARGPAELWRHPPSAGVRRDRATAARRRRPCREPGRPCRILRRRLP